MGRMNGFRDWLVLLLAALVCLPAMASDLEREQRWKAQIVDAILVGEAEMLDADGQEFLSIYTESDSQPLQGGVILIHGIGVHPDWPDVINPLRERLPEHGWSTLSLQMPVLEADAGAADYYPIFAEVQPRIDAGIRFLQAQGIDNIVIVAHSLGAQMAAWWLAQTDDPPVMGLVAIGLSGTRHEDNGDVPAWIAAITLPMLDLYGENDLPAVKNTAADRAAAAARAGNATFTQVEVPGAGHMFQGRNDALQEAVLNWLDANAAPSTD
jgi:pimeloyl-ACP methyl ester carboxylesterase